MNGFAKKMFCNDILKKHVWVVIDYADTMSA